MSADALVLWNAPVSTCSQKVRMALYEKALPFENRIINFRAAEHLSDWYLALNPNGVVPTLIHGGTPVVDSSVINEYLDDVFPERPLRPSDPRRRAEMRAWRQFIDEVPTTAIRVPSFQQVFRRIWQDMSEAEFEAHAARLPLRKHFYLKMRSGAFSEEDRAEAIDRLAATLDRLERTLAGGGPWIVGAQFTLADLSLMPTIVRMEDLGLAHLWDDRPAVAAWYARLKERPSFAQVYAEPARTLTPDV